MSQGGSSGGHGENADSGLGVSILGGEGDGPQRPRGRERSLFTHVHTLPGPLSVADHVHFREGAVASAFSRAPHLVYSFEQVHATCRANGSHLENEESNLWCYSESQFPAT